MDKSCFTLIGSSRRSNNFIDLSGRKFNRLAVISLAGHHVTQTKKLIWKCRCDCGVVCYESGYQLSRGGVQSCGCFNVEQTIRSNRTHGMRQTRIYRIWSGMWNRVRNPNCKDYRRYAGRGIRVCKRWLKFENFLADMGQPTSDRHSIDRIDNNGIYKPSNCKWSTAKEQASNRRMPSKRRCKEAKQCK